MILNASSFSDAFASPIDPAAFKNSGEAIAAELNIMNFLLVKLLGFDSISISFFIAARTWHRKAND